MIGSCALLWAWLWLNVSMILGYAFDKILQSVEFQLPKPVPEKSRSLSRRQIGHCPDFRHQLGDFFNYGPDGAADSGVTGAGCLYLFRQVLPDFTLDPLHPAVCLPTDG